MQVLCIKGSDIVANIDNLVYDKGFDSRTTEEQSEIARKGGIASGKARREKATMKYILEKMLQEKTNKGRTYEESIALGLIANAIDKSKGGSPEAYKTIAKMLGELETNENTETKEPIININITSNEDIKEEFYKEEE